MAEQVDTLLLVSEPANNFGTRFGYPVPAEITNDGHITKVVNLQKCMVPTQYCEGLSAPVGIAVQCYYCGQW